MSKPKNIAVTKAAIASITLLGLQAELNSGLEIIDINIPTQNSIAIG